ncbi:Coagulation Factor Viii [Manis pentadactyla]|nr:Coagulation Factor Viii [Manis pentadactyla]
MLGSFEREKEILRSKSPLRGRESRERETLGFHEREREVGEMLGAIGEGEREREREGTFEREGGREMLCSFEREGERDASLFEKGRDPLREREREREREMLGSFERERERDARLL